MPKLWLLEPPTGSFLLSLRADAGQSPLPSSSEPIKIKSDELQTDTIVLAMGMIPERQLLEELEKMGVNPHTAGDSNSVGKIMQAVHAGWDVGCKA